MTSPPQSGIDAEFIDFLRTLLPALVRETLTGVFQDAPDYQALPPEQLGIELPLAADANLRLFLDSVVEGRLPRAADVSDLIEIAVHRARAGVPLDAMLSVYHTGAAAAWNSVAALANTPEQREQLLALVPYVLGYLGAVTPGVAAAYLRERQDLHWEQREAERAVAQALVHGKPADLLAERFGISLDGSFQVLVFRLAESQGRPAASGRPVLRLAHAEIEALSPRALSMMERTGGVILIPAGDTESTGKLDTFVTRMATGTGLRTVAGHAVAAGPAQVCAAAEEAGEIVRLADRLHRPTGVYRMADLALQYQLARPGPARAWLLSLLTPLAEHEHLLATLRALIRHGYNRQEAADDLVVHRNTLNYRLNRIAVLTGYDPGRPDHAQLFAAALTASDIDAAE
ncbi:helix-turn-helix domain-containing protein [Nocardia sp. NPDC050435]|uniref:PucR family transcriptional regulator n=1 Tax=Nocardia sp. NPDC050435 TaxID=3155040 RepID=UPI0033CB25FD